jgi:hypothetical protein
MMVVYAGIVDGVALHATWENGAEGGNELLSTCTSGSVRGGNPPPLTSACYPFPGRTPDKPGKSTRFGCIVTEATRS